MTLILNECQKCRNLRTVSTGFMSCFDEMLRRLTTASFLCPRLTFRFLFAPSCFGPPGEEAASPRSAEHVLHSCKYAYKWPLISHNTPTAQVGLARSNPHSPSKYPEKRSLIYICLASSRYARLYLGHMCAGARFSIYKCKSF